MHRFVVAGSQLKEAVVPQSAGRFKFDGVYGLNAIEVPIIQDNRELTLYTRIAKARWGGGGGEREGCSNCGPFKVFRYI